jgi:hypothetical protein
MGTRAPPFSLPEIRLLIATILVALVASTIHASFYEWAFHRYWLHRPWLPKECFTQHTLIHHQLCKFDDTFHVVEEEQHEALHFQWWGGPLLIVIASVPWALLSLALHAAGVNLPYAPFLITFTAGTAIYYAGYESLHYLMHKPMFPWLERTRAFRFIERHHRIHHVRMNRNLNVLLPIADWVLGTLVTELEPHPVTPGSARKMARRHSRFGRSMPERGAHSRPTRTKPEGDNPVWQDSNDLHS